VFAWLITRVLDLMIEFIGSLYNWLRQLTTHWHTVIFFRLDTPRELFWLPPELPQFWSTRVRVTLRLAVYRQSFRLGVKPLETRDPRPEIFFNWILAVSPYVTSSLKRRWVCLLWICLAFHQVYKCAYTMLFKILPFALQISPLSVQALQNISCLCYVF
jgi:hypothetical protein